MNKQETDKFEGPEEELEEEPRVRVTDRRFWVQDESLEEGASKPERRYPTMVEELKARTELAEQKLKEKLKKLVQFV